MVSREVTRAGKVTRVSVVGEEMILSEGLKENCILECFTILLLPRLSNEEVI